MGSWSRFAGQFPDIIRLLLDGAWMTIVVTLGSLVVSILLGLVFAAFRTSQSHLLRALAHVYVEVFRAVPVLTQLFIVYFGLASIGIRLAPIPAALVGFGLHGGKRDRVTAYRFLVWLGIGVHLMSRWTPDESERREATRLAC